MRLDIHDYSKMKSKNHEGKEISPEIIEEIFREIIKNFPDNDWRYMHIQEAIKLAYKKGQEDFKENIHFKHDKEVFESGWEKGHDKAIDDVLKGLQEWYIYERKKGSGIGSHYEFLKGQIEKLKGDLK